MWPHRASAEQWLCNEEGRSDDARMEGFQLAKPATPHIYQKSSTQILFLKPIQRQTMRDNDCGKKLPGVDEGIPRRGWARGLAEGRHQTCCTNLHSLWVSYLHRFILFVKLQLFLCCSRGKRGQTLTKSEGPASINMAYVSYVLMFHGTSQKGLKSSSIQFLTSKVTEHQKD